MFKRTLLPVFLPICISSPLISESQEFDLGPIPEVEIECFIKASDAGKTKPDASKEGSWLQVRGDRKLTGRSLSIGDITCPEVLWAQDIAPVRKTWFAIQPNGGSSVVDLPTDGEVGSSGDVEMEFEIQGVLIDLNGDGSELTEPINGSGDRIGDLIPGTPGFERISCDPNHIGNTPHEDAEVPCFLQRWTNGSWSAPLWLSDPIGGMTANNGHDANAITGDFDNDGQLEVGLRGWYYITLLDLATGEIEQVGEFHDPNASGETSGRAYGWWAAHNIDEDPEHEIVIVGDFEQFISVLDWVNGNLQEIWDHQIEAGVNDPSTKHRTGVNPVADVDGDGKAEVITSIFNEHGDQRWHVVGRNGLTGEKEFDLVDRFLSGMGDLDGDGVSELFVTVTNGPAIPEFGDIAILSYDGGSSSEVWSATNTGFEIYNVPGFPDKVYTGATLRKRSAFLRDAWTTGTPVFITREKAGNGDDIRLRILQSQQGETTEIAGLVGPALAVLSLPSQAPERGILVRAYAESVDDGPVSLTGLSAEVEVGRRVDSTDHPQDASLKGGTVVGTMRIGSLPTVVTQGFGERLHAFRIDDGLKPTKLWERPGRGMISPDAWPYESVLLADILGTGELAVVAARKGNDGLGVITTYDADGSVIWEYTVNIPGDLPPWNEGGITTWSAGNFRSTEFEDVLVSWRIGTQHSTRMRLLDGQTGLPQWTQEIGGLCQGSKGTGAGGMHMPTLDWDNDGLDEVVNFASALFAIYDGNDGEILHNLWAWPFCGLPTVFTETFLEYATGVVADFLGNGGEQILYGKNAATLALLEFDANVLWNTPFYDIGLNYFSQQGVADLNGDGALNLVSVGHEPNGEIHAYDGATGAQRWVLQVPEYCGDHVSHVATGDIDGDGRDEAFFNDCNFLYAIGESETGQGEFLWRASFEHNRYARNQVVIADVDNSGRPQILINTGHGYLYGLGTTKPKVTDVGSVTSLNSNASSEVATLWGKFDGDIQVQVNDPSTGGQVARHKFLSDNWNAHEVITIPAAAFNTTTQDGVGLLATRVTDGLPIVQVKGASSGAVLANLFPWSTAWNPLQGEWVPGVGVATLATRKSDGLMGVELRNAASSTRTGIIYPLGLGWVPHSMAVIDVNGERAIGVLSFRESDGLTIVQTRRVDNSALVGHVFPLGLGWTAQEMKVMEDLNSNNVSEVAVRMTRDTDGLEIIQIRDASNNAFVANVYPIGAGGGGWSTRTFEPMQVNGQQALAILSTRDSDGQILVQLKHINNGTIIRNIFFLAPPWDPFGMKILNDFTGDGTDEIAMLTRKDGDGTALVQVRNGATGAVIRNLHQTGID